MSTEKDNDIPYIYNYRDKALFIVQNVKDGSRMKAISVIEYWKNNLINIGYNATRFKGKLVDKDNNVYKYKSITTKNLILKDLTRSYLIVYPGEEKHYAALLTLNTIVKSKK